MPAKSAVPQTIRPYMFHGLDLTLNSIGKQALGDCPWCGKEGKFSVEVTTGKWRCFSCNEGKGQSENAATHGGNSYTFLRLLHEYSFNQKHLFIESRLRGLATSRRLAFETLRAWGVTPSLLLPNDFLVPGFGLGDRINQLYRYTKTGEKRSLWAMPNHDHTLLGLNPNLYDLNKDTCYIAEGPWDGMALWEALRQVKWEDDSKSRLIRTSNPNASLLASANVLAVPGCTTFKEKWSEVLAGKKVVLLFDNDHPRLVNGRDAGRQGYNGMVAVARMLMAAYKPPLEISYLCWGKDGYDPELPNGFDVRDWLTDGGGRPLQALLDLIQPVPAEWAKGVKRGRSCGMLGVSSNALRPTWKQLVSEWKKALRFRDTLEDCLSVLLAVCLSTDQVGDQLFLQLIGEAGSAKTKLCEALLSSSYCYPLEKMRGFLSGWRGKDGEEDADYSLLNRINHKTLITAEGDLLLSNPSFAEIMSEQRRIFDGSTTSSYKNRREDRTYTGLRTPWIIAGTPALLNRADAHLGDRFLRIYIDRPDREEQAEILLRVAYAADEHTRHISNGEPEKAIPPRMLAAYKSTGAYVDYLRDNVKELVSGVENPEWAIHQCITLAKFTAYLRSRPDPNPNSERICSEEPTRLTQQFVRLAKNLAAVLGKSRVDDDVMRRVRKVALDTANGLTLDICRILYEAGDDGIDNTQYFTFRLMLDWKKRLEPILLFLRKIGVWDWYTPEGSKPRWRMLPAMRALYREVVIGKQKRWQQSGRQPSAKVCLECPNCNCKVSMAHKWLDEVGPPTCACGKLMEASNGNA